MGEGEVSQGFKKTKSWFTEFGYLICVGGMKHNVQMNEFPPHPNPFILYMADLTLKSVNNPTETVR